MSEIIGLDATMDERQVEYVTAALSALEDCRGLLRDAGKFECKAGIPLEFQSRLAAIRMDLESEEGRLSEYAVEAGA